MPEQSGLNFKIGGLEIYPSFQSLDHSVFLNLLCRFLQKSGGVFLDKVSKKNVILAFLWYGPRRRKEISGIFHHYRRYEQVPSSEMI